MKRARASGLKTHANLLVTVDTALSEISDASSDSIHQAQPSSLLPPSECSSASPLDIGVLIKSGTLRSIDKVFEAEAHKASPGC